MMRKRARGTAALAGAAAIVAAAWWARRDYQAWRALGPGGVPPTWRGWLQVTRWRLMQRDPIAISPLRHAQGQRPDDVAVLADLAVRAGPRPRIAPHPVPHRQLTDYAPADVKAALHAAFEARIAADPERLLYARSGYEKHNDAVTLRTDLCRHPDACATRGEIAHIHPSDGSMHMVLSAFDAATAVERGWGERHGFAGVTLGLPLTYTLIYAPRDLAEVASDGRMLDAAIAHMASD